MRKLTASLCLILSLFLASAGEGFALPQCPGSYNPNTWHNCFGTYTYANGDKYVGEFRDGKFHGQGTFTFANGNRYIGEFRNGKRSGQGTHNYAGGDTYAGEWRDDKRHGQGTYFFAEGRVDKGIWENGKSLKPWWKFW